MVYVARGESLLEAFNFVCSLGSPRSYGGGVLGGDRKGGCGRLPSAWAACLANERCISQLPPPEP